MVATGRIQTNEFMLFNGTATPGTGCAPNGLEGSAHRIRRPNKMHKWNWQLSNGGTTITQVHGGRLAAQDYRQTLAGERNSSKYHKILDHETALYKATLTAILLRRIKMTKVSG
jgi:hypothetical protein